MFHKNDIDRNRNNIGCIGGDRRDGCPQYIQCYYEIAATTMDKNGKYTTINLMSGHPIAAAFPDDGIREYCVASSWRASGTMDNCGSPGTPNTCLKAI
eukprot:scaffold32486_cov66-Cyclotella_meneghiniana.AAC.9